MGTFTLGHFILPAAEVSLNKCWLSVFLIRDFLLPGFGGSKFCTLIIYLFSAFICCVKVCKICIDRKVTDWFALYVSEVFRRSVTHINHSIIFIRIILHYLLLLLFLLILCKFCASAVICLAGICQKHGANSVLVPKICNNSFKNSYNFHWFSLCWVDYILRRFMGTQRDFNSCLKSRSFHAHVEAGKNLMLDTSFILEEWLYYFISRLHFVNSSGMDDLVAFIFQAENCTVKMFVPETCKAFEGLFIFLYNYIWHTVWYLFICLSWKYQDKEKLVHKLRYSLLIIKSCLVLYDSEIIVLWLFHEHLFYDCYKNALLNKDYIYTFNGFVCVWFR